MPRDRFKGFLARERKAFASRYPDVTDRSQDAIREAILGRWKKMVASERVDYFNGTWYYPAQAWREPECVGCRANNSRCNFDAENNMCERCRELNARLPMPQMCERRCGDHTAAPTLPRDCIHCQFFSRRYCVECRDRRVPCTFDGDKPCQQCQQFYANGEIINGCLELRDACDLSKLNNGPGTQGCSQCVFRRVYRTPDVGTPETIRKKRERRQEKFARDFIRSQLGAAISGTENWVGKQILGRGGMGSVGVWARIDAHNVIQEMIAVKDVPLKESSAWSGESPENEWNQPHIWYDKATRVPLETKLHEVVHQEHCRNITSLLGWRRYIERGAFRLYLEFCPHGDLAEVMYSYDQSLNFIPESFLWYLFLSLARACVAMEHVGARWQEPQNPRWTNDTDIVHLDLKPSNVFLGAPRGAGFLEYEYPTPKLGDFGLAEYTDRNDPRNPGFFDFIGTEGYKNPEQLGYANQFNDQVLSWSNIFSVGVLMWGMSVLKFRYEEPTEDDRLQMRTTATEAFSQLPVFQSWYPFNPWVYSQALEDLITTCLRYRPNDRPTPSDLVVNIQNEIQQREGQWRREQSATPGAHNLDCGQFKWRVGYSATGWDETGVRTRRG